MEKASNAATSCVWLSPSAIRVDAFFISTVMSTELLLQDLKLLLAEEEKREFNEEEFNLLLDLEKAWKKSLSRYTSIELLSIFPNVTEIISGKILELREHRENIVSIIKNKLMAITKQIQDESAKWFWREVVKSQEGNDLVMIDAHIKRLERLQNTQNGRKTKGIQSHITDEQIFQAKEIPIETLFDGTLVKCGKNLKGLCPFHDDKRPSFYVFPKTNTCWCFSCSAGGDSIKFIQLTHNYSFKETIKYLIEKV